MIQHADLLIFSVFLALNLIIGLLAGRKVKTVREFAIGNKNFSTGTVTATLVATWISGGFMFFGLEHIYKEGLSFFIICLGGGIGLLLKAHLLIPRMGEFLNNMSLAESMGNLYGKNVRIISAISGMVGRIGYVAVQLKVIARILTLVLEKSPINTNFLHTNSEEITILAATILILYAAFGGIRAVTITDVFQFITFIIFIPTLALIIWNHLENPARIINTIQENPNFNLKNLIKWDKSFLTALGLMLYQSIPTFTPPLFQRVVISQNTLQAKKAFTYAAFIDFFVCTMICLLAILLLTDNPNLDPSKLINYIIDKYTYTGLKGLIAVGIVAMSMSTADSELHACSVTLMNDLVNPLFPQWKMTVSKIRIATLALGLSALLLAFYTKDLLTTILLSASLYLPVVGVPFLMAILGFRSTPKVVIISMAAGLLTVITWKLYLKDIGLDSIIPGMLVNAAFLFGAHYLLQQPGGWVGIKDKGHLLATRQTRRAYWQTLYLNFKNVNITESLAASLPKYDVIYILFGLYLLGATYSLFFIIPQSLTTQYQLLYTTSAYAILTLAAIFLSYPAWPNSLKNKWIKMSIWSIGTCYSLFVVGIQLVMMSSFNPIHIMIVLLNILLTAFLLTWPLMVLLATLGIIIGILSFKLLYGVFLTEGIFSQFNLIYGSVLIGIFLVTVFIIEQKIKYIKAQNLLAQKSLKDSQKEYLEIIRTSETELEEMIAIQGFLPPLAVEYINHIIYRIKDYMSLNVEKFPLATLLNNTRLTLRLKDYPAPPRLHLDFTSPIEVIEADADKLQNLLVNTITAIQAHNPFNKPINLIAAKAKIGYHFKHIQDYTREMDAIKFIITIDEQLPNNLPAYTVRNPLMKDLPIAELSAEEVENTRIIDAHYGYREIVNQTTYVYVLPANLREIRGKVMELLREPVAADPAELAHPIAIQLEKELLEKIKTYPIDEQAIKKALDTIKKYHAGVKRKSGEPFFTHPMAVALILLTYCQDQEAVIAALLHDTVEDTRLSTVQVEALFGKTVAFLVTKVTKLEDNIRRAMLKDHETIQRLINYEDKRAAYIKLADRMHNMRTIKGHSSLKKQQHIAAETLNFFVPMAKELGLTAVAQELGERSLAVLGKS